MKYWKIVIMALALATVALFAAGCGGGDGSDDNGSSSDDTVEHRKESMSFEREGPSPLHVQGPGAFDF